MKREGRQHGVVRSYAILPPPLSQRRHVKIVDSASVTGVFTKVSTKPTNQSKFTGKCGKARCNGCHIHPACKSKDKCKGTMKLRSIRCPAGTSATGAFDYLANDGSYDAGDEYEYEGEYESVVDEYDYGDYRKCNVEFGIGLAAIVTEENIGSEDEDECMSYCDLGLFWGEGDAGEYYGDDEWYLVGHS